MHKGLDRCRKLDSSSVLSILRVLSFIVAHLLENRARAMVLCREFGKVLFEVALNLKFSFAEEAKTHAVAESPRADADGE